MVCIHKGPRPALTRKPQATVDAKLPQAESTYPLSQWSNIWQHKGHVVVLY